MAPSFGITLAAWTALGVAACGSGERPHSAPSANQASAPPAKTPAALSPARDPAVQVEEPHDPAAPLAACGDARQCDALGLQAERAGQAERAAELFGLACDQELGQACFRLGQMLRDGKGVKPDEARANELFTRGCRYGSESACDALGH